MRRSRSMISATVTNSQPSIARRIVATFSPIRVTMKKKKCATGG